MQEQTQLKGTPSQKNLPMNRKKSKAYNKTFLDNFIISHNI